MSTGRGISIGGRTSVRLGRATDNDLALDDLRVSRHHAELRASAGGGWDVVDLGSSNGTFVNGTRVDRPRRVGEGDFIGLGGQTLRLRGDALQIVTTRHTAWFGAVDLVVETEGRRILDEVGFALEPSSMLGIVGPSGSGKSTLLNALTGFRPAGSGRVVFDGRDLYATYDDVRSRIGLVPQSDILHTQLTVRQALGYEAQLRFPRDVSTAQRQRRIDEVMAELHLSERADVRIEKLSGGQRKRVSVACELLTEPALLFLDEPTSGLDPGNEAALMALLRDLARAGRIVVVVTHSVQSLDLCDRVLILAPGGRLAYYGRPADALASFAKVAPANSYADVFRTLEEGTTIDWKERFQAEPEFDRLVRAPLASADLAPVPKLPAIDPPPPRTPFFHQLWVLLRRYVAVIAADRGFVLALALQAPIFGLLFSLMYPLNVMTTSDALSASILTWLIVVGATWLGTSNAIREIVKELPIYRRERAIGLSAAAYVASKVVVLGAITAVQVAVLVPIAMRMQRLPATDDLEAAQVLAQGLGNSPVHIASGGTILSSQSLELIVVAIVVGIAGMSLGLLISALAGGVDRAATLLPILLVAQVIASAPVAGQTSPVLQSVGYALSAQWGMAAAASTLDLQEVRGLYVFITEYARTSTKPDPRTYERATWQHTPDAWLADIGALGALTVVGVGGAWFALRRRDPGLTERRGGIRRGRRVRASSPA